jgi:UDP-glucose 4-epimerase
MRTVEQVTGQRVPHEIGPRRAGDPAVLVANSDKLKRMLAWKPKFADLKDIVATAWQFENERAVASE